MIDIVSVLLILALAGLGSRYLSQDEDSDSHNIFCLGMCAHVMEKDEQTKDHEHDPDDPNDPCEDHDHE